MTGAKSKKNGRPAVTRNGSAERMRRYRERKRQGVVSDLKGLVEQRVRLHFPRAHVLVAKGGLLAVAQPTQHGCLVRHGGVSAD